MASDSKNPKPEVQETEPAAVLSVTDFCIRLSETVKRPELINAFAHVELKDQRVSDTVENFRARFDAFVNKPV